MTNGTVLDTSALLALLHGERGGNLVADTLPYAHLSSVNLAEALTKLVERGVPPARAEFLCQPPGVRIHDFTTRQAGIAAALRPLTRRAGLSLGDRACLALGRDLGLPVLTADQAWSSIAEAAGVTVTLIRSPA